MFIFAFLSFLFSSLRNLKSVENWQRGMSEHLASVIKAIEKDFS
jgi:hypothetical protein